MGEVLPRGDGFRGKISLPKFLAHFWVKDDGHGAGRQPRAKLWVVGFLWPLRSTEETAPWIQWLKGFLD